MTRFLAPPPVREAEPGRTPTFSVVIAAYQVADVIGDALDSVRGQTLAPLEVIVCDDGSTDDLAGALAPYRDEIVLIRKENGGEGSAKNAAAARAHGDFIAILDADDVYLPTRLESLAELARARPDLDILTTDAYLEANGTIVRRCYADGWTFEANDQRREILERNFVFGHVAVKRELFLSHGGFDESIPRTTDWDCWLRMILAGARVGAVMEPLSVYRVRETSLSADRRGMVAGKIGTLEKALANPSLTASDVQVLHRSLGRYRTELAIEDLRSTLAQGRPARGLAARITVSREARIRERLEAGASVAAPRLVGRALRRRARRAWVGAGGVRVVREASDSGPSSSPI